MAGFFTVGILDAFEPPDGFARDIMIAAYLGRARGRGVFVAFSLPNMFRRFFAEGAFNMAFVPMFSKKVEADEGALNSRRMRLSACTLF